MTVNHDVAGSSPARGAKNPSILVRNHEISEDFLFEIHEKKRKATVKQKSDRLRGRRNTRVTVNRKHELYN